MAMRGHRAMFVLACVLTGAASSARGVELPPPRSWDGVGRIGADFFPVPSGAGRHARRLIRSYGTDTDWGNAALIEPWLAPGPDGPIATVDLEMFREGVQECEARIFIERALADPEKRARLGEALAARAQALLDERTRYAMWVFDVSYMNYNQGGSTLGRPLDLGWFAGSGWQERSEKLYNMAAGVAQALDR